MANTLFDRAMQEDSTQMLDCAIEVFNGLVEHATETEAEYPEWLAGLARGLYERAARLGQVGDLENSLSRWARVLELAADRGPAIVWLDGYALALRLRFIWQGSVQDLTDAIALWEYAMENATESDHALAGVLGNLAGVLRERYTALGDNRDLDTAAGYAEQALSLAQDDADTMVSLLGQHAAILQDRYTRFGEPDDLEVAITELTRARELAGEAHPLSSEVLHALGLVYRLRYLRAGTLRDLENALQAFVDAIQSTPADAALRLARYEGDLALALVERFRHAHQASDLDQAIDLFDSALKQLPAQAPQRAAILSNQGMAYGSRYKHVSQELADLQSATKAFEHAVEAAPASSVERLAFLNNLANQTHEIYLQTGSIEQLDRALKAIQEAVEKALASLPARPIYLATLGVVLRAKFDEQQQPEDRDAAAAAYREGATSGLQLNLELAMGNARNWLHWAFERSAWAEVTEAYDLLRRAIEQLLQAQVLRRTKEVWLSEIQGITARAAYAFAMQGREEEAALALEEGQARLVSEKLALSRTNLESLKGTRHQALYDRFHDTVKVWETAQHADPDELSDLYAQLSKLTVAIRAIPGHEDFLRSSGIQEIARAARDRVLVYLAATSAGGMALLVESASDRVKVRSITLSQLTTETLDSRVQGTATGPGYLTTYRHWLALPRDTQARQTWFKELDALGGWLWEVGLGAIAETLPQGAQVTLIPAGSLALLPLHLAWEQPDSNRQRRYFSVLAVLSYAPNARTIVMAADRLDEMGGPGVQPETLVAVHSSYNPEAEVLQGAPLEVAAVQRHFAAPLVFEDKQATRENVLKALHACTVGHFACHGRADLAAPLNSGLLMADGQWLTVADLMAAQPSQLRLAVLSACETAMPGTQLPDEVVALPGGLLAAGACGIVASLWSVSDASTMLLMTRFYDGWIARGLTPAKALARAQSWLRAASNEELLAYVREAVQRGFATEQGYRLLRLAIGFQSLQAKAFYAPFLLGGILLCGRLMPRIQTAARSSRTGAGWRTSVLLPAC